MNEEIEIRRLVIKTFHIKKVEFSQNNRTFIENKILYLRPDINNEILTSTNKYIKNLEMKIIYPEQHDVFTNSIMDFSPIATKVLGKLGEGITHVLTGVYVMLTGVDEKGIQVAEFGSSEGILKEQVSFGRAGTPSKEDILINIDVLLKEGMGTKREGIMEVHKICDKFIQEIREYLKSMNGRNCDEKHEYIDKVRPNKEKVVIVKQVAGQGAMYDTLLFPKEAAGFEGGKSIIDIGNVPIIVSPNEYRDGALRAMH